MENEQKLKWLGKKAYVVFHCPECGRIMPQNRALKEKHAEGCIRGEKPCQTSL